MTYFATFILIIFAFINDVFAADTELNTDFLQGVQGVPSVLQSGIKYPAGTYDVDVKVNGAMTARASLVISKSDEVAGNICLSPEWLKNAGVFIKSDMYKSIFNKARGCYIWGREKNSQIDFDYGAQELDFNIPQAYLLDKTDSTRWDYGVDGLRVSYSGNFNSNSDTSLNAFGNFKTSINLGRWVLSSNMNAARSSHKNEFTTNDVTLSTAISQVKGDFQLGRSQTRTDLFSDFGFYGVALRSNSNMRPWGSSGYAPIISGVATSISRITISQGGYTIYSKVVPAGPYQLDDISPVSNGDLLVTVEDDSGAKTSSIYPVSTLPSLLRPGDYSYNVALGQKVDSNNIDDIFDSNHGTFLLGSFDYGLSETTINLAAILHNKYQSGGLGLTQSLGQFGVLSSNVNLSKANYDDNTIEHGASFAFKYAKNFTNRTDLQLLTYRYQSSGYREFASFDPKFSYDTSPEKMRYEARLSHRLDNNVYLSSSLWRQSYWNNDRHSIGANISTSAMIFDDVSLYVNGGYSRGVYDDQDDYSVSVGVSIPFSFNGDRHYSSNSIGYSRGSGTTFNSGVSATVNDRLNYSINANASSFGSTGASANLSYAFDTVQTNFGISKNGERTTLSGSLSGSAVATSESGLLLTKESSDTIAIVKIKDMPGIKFNSSLPTNEDGETSVFLSPYRQANININTENVPDDIELLNSSFTVVPTENSIIYREFNFSKIQRYILQVRDMKGNIIRGGDAETDFGANAGFVSNNGVLIMNLKVKPKYVYVNNYDGKKCKINTSTLNGNTNYVQEVRCE